MLIPNESNSFSLVLPIKGYGPEKNVLFLKKGANTPLKPENFNENDSIKSAYQRTLL